MELAAPFQLHFVAHATVWVANDSKDPTAWRKARITAERDSLYHLLYLDEAGGTDQKPAAFLEPASSPTTELSNDALPTDITALSHLNCPSIYELVESRFFDEQHWGVYTNAGPVLVAVNPCQTLPIYSQEVIQQYINAYNAAWDCNNKVLEGMQPHVFKVAAQAYKQMVQQQQSQAVVVTGESGAGKTETTKLFMRFLSTISGASGLAERMLQSNPILEAFGNAKTSRNPNSSRFGKLLSIHFAAQPTARNPPITRASLATYLLEKSRIVGQAPGERNYHVFYMLLAGACPEERAAWRLPPVGTQGAAGGFSYLQGGEEVLEGRDDAAEWRDLRAAMVTVGLAQEEEAAVLRLVAGVLWLGNVELEEAEGGPGGQAAAVVAEGRGQEALQNAAALLLLDEGALERALTRKLQVMRSEKIEKRYSMAEAVVARDSLAKAIYSDLFDHLVAAINGQLAQPQPGVRPSKEDPAIAVLDIFGFENFADNSFEQLCINYANERLQQLFCHHLLRREQAEYEAEGVEWRLQDTTDNAAILDLLHAPDELGVLPLLNDACLLPVGQQQSTQAADENLAERLRGKHRKHPGFTAPPGKPLVFGIRHFAELVEYSVAGMVAKNRDTLPPELMNLMEGSRCELLRGWGELRHRVALLASRRGGARSRQLVAWRFKAEVDDLVKVLTASQLQFVRCIKPNPTLTPYHLHPPTVIAQLKWAGVLEVAEIYKRGFPTRYTRTAVVKRYSDDLFPVEEQVAAGHPDDRCRQVLGLHGLWEGRDYVMGYTKVFFKAGRLAQLEDQWLLRRRAVATISAAWRNRCLYLVVQSVLEEARHRRQAATVIQRWYRGRRSNRALRALQRTLRMLLDAQRLRPPQEQHTEAAAQLPQDPELLCPAAAPALLQELQSDRAWLQYEAQCLATGPDQLGVTDSLQLQLAKTSFTTGSRDSALLGTWEASTAQALRTWLTDLFCSDVQHPDQLLVINLVTSLDQYAAALDLALRRLYQHTGGRRPDAPDSPAAQEVDRVKGQAAGWCSKFELRLADGRAHLRRVEAASEGCLEAEAAARQLLRHLSLLRDAYFLPWRGRVLDALEELLPLARPTTRNPSSSNGDSGGFRTPSLSSGFASRAASRITTSWMRWKA